MAKKLITSFILIILLSNAVFAGKAKPAINDKPKKSAGMLVNSPAVNNSYYYIYAKIPLYGIGLNLLWPGLGNMYAGQYRNGTVLFVSYLFFYAHLYDEYGRLDFYAAEKRKYLFAVAVIQLTGIITGALDVNQYNNKLKKKFNIVSARVSMTDFSGVPTMYLLADRRFR